MVRIGMIASIIAAAAFAVAALVSTITPAPKYLDYLRVKDSVENSTDPFMPGFVHKRHSAILFKIENYRITDSLTLTKGGHHATFLFRRRVRGDFPSMRAGGTFEVIFDSGGHSVSSYFMPSPLYRRIEQGPGKGLFKIKEGTFELPVPDSILALPNLRIILKDQGNRIHHVDFN